jgi:hypothetical protein
LVLSPPLLFLSGSKFPQIILRQHILEQSGRERNIEEEEDTVERERGG